VALSPADFRTLAHITLTVHSGPNNADDSYSGVPLATLLAIVNAPIRPGPPFPLNPIQSKGLTEIILHPWLHPDHLLF
jgi:hypothetical protein